MRTTAVLLTLSAVATACGRPNPDSALGTFVQAEAAVTLDVAHPAEAVTDSTITAPERGHPSAPSNELRTVALPESAAARRAEAEHAEVRLEATLPRRTAETVPRSATGPGRTRPAERPEEVFLELRYRDAVRTIITALLHDDSLYLPLREILGHLQVQAVYRPFDRSVRGFLRSESNRFDVSADALEAVVGTTRVSLTEDDILVSGDDLYLRQEVFGQLFDVAIVLDWTTLTLQLASEETFPVLLAGRRVIRRSGLLHAAQRPQPATSYAREPRRLGGGVAQYSVTVAGTGDGAAAGLNLGAGAEILGGDAEFAFSGFVSGAGQSTALRGRWRYVHEGTPWIRQTLAGRFWAGGLEVRDLIGVEVTNRPVQPRSSFGSDSVHGAVAPGWEVELYVNGRLAGFTLADESGRYAFPIGLAYGSSIIELRLYGPAGEERIERRRIQLPFVLLPQAEVEYDAVAGYDAVHSAPAAAVQLRAGVHDRVTLRAGVDWTTPHLAAFGLAPFNTLVGLELALDAFARASAESFLGTSGQFGASFTQYGDNDLFNPRRLQHETQLRAFWPMYVRGHPLNLRVSAGDARALGGWDIRAFGGEAALMIDRWRLLGAYDQASSFGALHRQEVRFGAAHYIVARSERHRGLTGAILRTEWGYDFARDRLGTALVEAVVPVMRRGRLSVGVDRTATRGWGAQLRLQLDRSAFRATTMARANAAGGAISQTVRGGVGYDDAHGELTFTEREWVGRAGATIRLFVDENGNGVYDEGEELVRGGAVSFGESLVVRADSSGVIRTPDLLAYHPYVARINTAHIPNPLWLPQHESFLIVTDPNRYKPIDIPFYAAGVVEGYTRVEYNGGARGLAGLNIILRSEQGTEITLRTYSDGSFYHLGLAPGRWEAIVEPTQLDLLGLQSDPLVREFVVRTTTDGDFVEDVDFLLSLAPPAAPLEHARHQRD